MKYWRGYLVAAILAAITLGFQEIAQTHTKLVDMIYPYVTRMVQNFMVGWSGAVDFCVWQMILMAMIVLGFATVVLMVIFRWNPIQWFGWILAAASLVLLLHTGIYGMNQYAGPLSEDIRLEVLDGTNDEMQAAAIYFRDKANELSQQVSYSGDEVTLPTLDALSEQAADGFDDLVYEQYYSVFAGSNDPVKELGMSDYFTARGQMGYTVAITGEAAVNMDAPGVLVPFAICREMSYRRSIASNRDKHFAAFMACQANEDPLFQYAGYVMAYRYCLNALPASAANTVGAQANTRVRDAVAAIDEFLAADPEAKTLDTDKILQKLRQLVDKDSKDETQKETLEEVIWKDNTQNGADGEIAQLLASWHQQMVVLPSMAEPEVIFDPYDESMVDMTGLPHVS